MRYTKDELFNGELNGKKLYIVASETDDSFNIYLENPKQFTITTPVACNYGDDDERLLILQDGLIMSERGWADDDVAFSTFPEAFAYYLKCLQAHYPKEKFNFKVT